MMRFLRAGGSALLIELDDLEQALALLASLESEPIAGIDDLTPGARTLLVSYRPSALSHDELVERVGRRRLDEPVVRADTLVEIPVDYQGEDLDEVAGLLGISSDEVIRRHTEHDYTVAFTGFAPGFAYLAGGHPSLDVPRRATPRTRIPAGAVGLAGKFSGIYPRASPGGWQIIGVTDTPMWDLARDVPALLQPGFKVRFLRRRGQRARSAAPPIEAPAKAKAEGVALEIIGSGLPALFEDAGRHGYARQGVTVSGAMDKRALRAANRLVGNPSDAACVELVYGGFEVVCRGDAVVACTGADVPIRLVLAGGARRTVSGYEPLALCDGDRLSIGEPRSGVRSYLAARGGFDVSPVLGSCSTDTLAQIGPAPLAVGDVLVVRPLSRGGIVGMPEATPADLPSVERPVTLDVTPGPRADWFTSAAVALLASQSWKVTPESSRVGLRLIGAEALVRANHSELPSEGTPMGAVQVPASGQPVLFLADHPLTGGYPVIAVVAAHDLDRAGQIPIGATVRFNPIPHAGARGQP